MLPRSLVLWGELLHVRILQLQALSTDSYVAAHEASEVIKLVYGRTKIHLHSVTLLIGEKSPRSMGSVAW